ncbi:MAG: SusD/RagB family nutrient-binding outer membrane lipoprotein, partial [Chitinophagaceae bacterium]
VTIVAGSDYYGDVPMTDALQGIGKQFPAYDTQESIYTAIQKMLDDGIVEINKNLGLKPGSDDFFYAGDMNKWKRLAYTLKARYYLRLSKVYPAATQADLALQALSNGMTSNADDLKFTYPGTAGYFNRWYNAMLPGETVIFATTVIDTLAARSDPRLGILAAPAVSDGQYRGRKIGISFASLPSLNSFSVVGSFYGAQASPTFLVNYSEALFIKAEATLIKSGAAAAEPIYQDGIRSHTTKLNVPAAAVTNYLGQRGTLTTANALQRIIEEKVIANFLSIENWNDWRKTGFPVLTPVTNASLTELPRRFFYPQSELNTNPQSVHNAKLTDRVWWDKL